MSGRITPLLLAWVRLRRQRGVPWKVIERALREAGLPAHRQQYHAAMDVKERRRRAAERQRALRNRRRGTGTKPT